MNLNDKFHYISTVILTAAPSGSSQGTGFFYELLDSTNKKGPHWRKIKGLWLVTNRHVILSRHNEVEVKPSNITFYFRKVESEALKWEPITLSKDDIEARVRFHPDNNIDVAVIDVLDLFVKGLKSGEKYTQWYGVSKDNFAGKNNIDVETSCDVLIVGYPRGFYDDVNLFPIIKSGIVASRWDENFQGNRYFLIDAKLFPGSSGSIVISKPIDVVVKKGKIMHSSEKQFAFLGIFSGEPFHHENPVELDDMIIIQKSSFNLGIVWYAELVEEILDSGVPLSKAIDI